LEDNITTDLKKRCEDLAGSGEVSMAGPYEKSNAHGVAKKTREIVPPAEQFQASLGAVCSTELFHLHC
jgi:hypothetical protein